MTTDDEPTPLEDLAPNPTTLPDQSWIFVLEYVKDYNKTQAAIRAGFAESSAHDVGWRLLRKNEVQDAVWALQLSRAKRLRIEADFLTLQFFDVYMQAREAGNFAAAIRALTEIGKHIGYYELDNNQRIFADIDEVKSRLRARGYDIDRPQRLPRKKELVPSNS